MSIFSLGYAQVNINPPLGIDISGYYVPRFAKGYLDELQAGALALSHGDTTILLISMDGSAQGRKGSFQHACPGGSPPCP